MPIYEYECGSCKQVTEVMQKISDPGPSECPRCHQGPMAKIMSMTGFILKGSGWYVTDFRDSKKKSPPSPDSTSDKEATKADTPKDAAVESKTAPASETKPASIPSTAPAVSSPSPAKT